MKSKSVMKFSLLAMMLLCGLPSTGKAQDERLCKGRPVPSGYRIVGESIATECGGQSAWVIRKIGAPPPPVVGTNGSESELGEGPPEAEVRVIRKLTVGGKNTANIPLQINGYIQSSSAYDGPYLNAESTHSAFEITDGTGHIYVYALKNEVNGLRRKLALQKGKLRGVFTVVLPPERPFGGDIFADLIGYKLIETPPAEAQPKKETKPATRPRVRQPRQATPPNRPVNGGDMPRRLQPPPTLAASLN